jgi:hypothetical protein
MKPRGFADSFFSPDYAAGLGVLFQKLNQVHIPVIPPDARLRSCADQKGVYRE